MTVQGEEKLIMLIAVESNCVKYCDYNEELLTIFTLYTVGHGDRYRMEYEIGRLKENCNNYTAETNLRFVKKKLYIIINIFKIYNSISLQEAARTFSNLEGQKYDRCTCTCKILNDSFL